MGIPAPLGLPAHKVQLVFPARSVRQEHREFPDQLELRVR